MKGRDAWRAAWRAARCIRELRELEAAVIAKYGSMDKAVRTMPPDEYQRWTHTRAEIDATLAAVPLVAAGKAMIARGNRDHPEQLTSMREQGAALWRFVRQLHPRLRVAAMKWPHGRIP